jgi:hypothetical protein
MALSATSIIYMFIVGFYYTRAGMVNRHPIVIFKVFLWEFGVTPGIIRKKVNDDQKC